MSTLTEVSVEDDEAISQVHEIDDLSTFQAMRELSASSIPATCTTAPAHHALLHVTARDRV